MMYVEIYWKSGVKKYSQVSLPFSDHQSFPFLAKKIKISRSISLSSLENQTAVFVLLDHTNHFSEMLSTEELFGKKIVIRTMQDILFTGYVSAWPQYTVDQLEVKADTFSVLKGKLNRVITEAEFTEAPDESLEKYSNIIYGNMDFLPVPLVARMVAPGKYLAAWNRIVELTAVILPDESSIFAESVLEVDVVTGYSYILYTHQGEEDVFEVYFSAVGELSNPIEMLQAALPGIEFAGIAETAAIMIDRGYLGNYLVVSGSEDKKRLLVDFQNSFNCLLYFNRAGQLCSKVTRWGVEEPVLRINYTEISKYRYWRSPDLLKGSWKRKYQYSPRQNKHLRNFSDVAGNPSSNSSGEMIQQFLRDDVASQDIAARNAFFLKKPLEYVSLEIPSHRILFDLGDIIEVMHLESFYPNQYRYIQVLRIRHNENDDFVFIEGLDVTGIQKGFFVIREAGESVELKENDHPIII